MSPDALIPCGGCHRHVRASEAACPFCARPITDASLAGVVPEPTQRLSRAGVLAFAAAFLSTACPSQPGPTPAASTDVGMMQTIYGGPPPMPPPPPTPPATQDASTGSAVPVPPPTPVYGAPPPPAPPTPRRRPRSHAQETTPSVPMPAYGISPRPDPGSMVTRYGAPPRPTEPSLD
jgi:hypothetical protein